MRRMMTNGQIVNTVNAAIKSGEIQAGGLPEIESGDAGKALVVNAGETGPEWATVGLSPEDQEKLDNSLQLPETAPASQQLVGINTSGEQNAIGIGNGLDIDSNTLESKILYIDYSTTTLTSNKEIDADVYAKLSNRFYDIVIIGQTYVKSIVFFKDTNNIPATYSADYVDGNVSSSPSVRGFGVDKVQPIRHAIISFMGSNNIKVTQSSEDVVRYTNTLISLTGTSGTLSTSQLNKLKDNCNYFPAAYAISSTTAIGAIFHLTSINSAYIIFKNIPNSEITTQYELKISATDGA